MTKTDGYPVYFTTHHPKDKHPRTWVPVLRDIEFARVLIRKMIDDREHERKGNILTIHRVNADITVRCDFMDQALQEPDLTFMELPVQERTRLIQFNSGQWDEEWDEPEPKPEPKKSSAKKASGKKPAKRAGRPDGYLTISQIVDGTDMKPSEARAMLRASNVKKPDFGWAFAPDKVAEIKKVIGL